MDATKRIVRDFSIANGASQVVVGGVDLVDGTLVGILCPSDLKGLSSMTFDVSPGSAATRGLNQPSAPAESSDWFDAKDQGGSTEAITVTLSAGDACLFDATTTAKAANFPRWIRPTGNTTTSGAVTFGAIIRPY